MRAADAAKNTSSLIENTVKAVRVNSDLTNSTRDAFKENVDIAVKVGTLVDEIAAASNEQAQGIGQINKAIHEMDKVVQRNASNAEESASASEEMSAQADTMKDIVLELVAVISGNGANSNGDGGPVRMKTVKRINAPLLAETTGKHENFPPSRERGTVEPAGDGRLIAHRKPEVTDF